MNVAPIIWTLIFYIFCSVVAIQLFYYLYFFIRLAFHKQVTPREEMEHAVSVVICARDEAHNLVQTMPAVLVQDYKSSFEVVLVNDNSTDDTKYLIDEFKKAFKNINHVLLTQEAKMIAGKKFPLSMGIKSAKYEIVLLTDADCVPATEHWIKKMQAAYTDNIEIVLGYGAYRKKPGFLNKLIRFETFHTALQYLTYALSGNPYMGVGRNLSYKKQVFLRNKGFSSINQVPSGDDDLFINQVATARNTAVCIDPDTHTLSEPKSTWNEWMAQKYRHYTTSRYYKSNHKFLLGLYSTSQFLLYPLLIVSIIFYSWWISLAVFGVRFLIQAYVFYKGMKKLNELDLWPLFIVFDIFMFFYYLFTLPAIWKAPRKNWD